MLAQNAFTAISFYKDIVAFKSQSTLRRPFQTTIMSLVRSANIYLVVYSQDIHNFGNTSYRRDYTLINNIEVPSFIFIFSPSLFFSNGELATSSLPCG